MGGTKAGHGCPLYAERGFWQETDWLAKDTDWAYLG